jgi:hypothetical protein
MMMVVTMMVNFEGVLFGCLTREASRDYPLPGGWRGIPLCI